MTVEQVYPNLFAAKLLHSVPFAPDERRGGVLGLIGRLANEPAIPEDGRVSGGSAYKGGVTPSERKSSLLKLWGWLTPHSGNEEAIPLLNAIKEEMDTIDSNAIPAYEEGLVKQAKDQADAKAKSIVLKAEMAERQKQREAEEDRRAKARLIPAVVVAPVVVPVIEPVKVEESVIEEEAPNTFEELIDGRTECTPVSEAETFVCIACNGVFKNDEKMILDGQQVCQSCHEIFS
jgi:hypothetical protein